MVPVSRPVIAIPAFSTRAKTPDKAQNITMTKPSIGSVLNWSLEPVRKRMAESSDLTLKMLDEIGQQQIGTNVRTRHHLAHDPGLETILSVRVGSQNPDRDLGLKDRFDENLPFTDIWRMAGHGRTYSYTEIPTPGSVSSVNGRFQAHPGHSNKQE